jgi:adenylylsulfate kinase
MQKNIVKHSYSVNLDSRKKLKQHQPLLLWFTGLSGSGKSTIANCVEQELHKNSIHTYTLDGDNIRKGLNSDLSFSPEDRTENIRRIAETAHLMMDAGLVVLAAFVSPYRIDRDHIRNVVGHNNMIEIYIKTSVEECERRDVKGLYKKARKGEIKNMTGISAPYESPLHPDIQINTEEITVIEATKQIINFINPKLILHNE